MNQITYEEAFEALSGLSIGHVTFSRWSSGCKYISYVYSNEELQDHIDKLSGGTGYVGFVIGDDMDSGVQKAVVNIFFDIRSRKMMVAGRAPIEYNYVNALFNKLPGELPVSEGGRALHYDTFKQVMRIEWDWEVSSSFSLFKRKVIRKWRVYIKSLMSILGIKGSYDC